MTENAPLPRPVPDTTTAFFWEAARRHELHLQWCADCERFQHTPAPYCFGCGREGLGSRRVSGLGEVYSLTTLHDPPGPAFAARMPLTVVVMELDEQPGLLLAADLVAGSDPVRIGDRVKVVYEDVDADLTLPQISKVQR